MLDVVLVACMIAKPDICDRFRIPEAFENTQTVGCNAKAQEVMSDYMKGHSLFRIVKFGCERHDSEDT